MEKEAEKLIKKYFFKITKDEQNTFKTIFSKGEMDKSLNEIIVSLNDDLLNEAVNYLNVCTMKPKEDDLT